MLQIRANPATIHAFDVQYGLLKPLPVQYLTWLSQLLRGNLGFSYKQNQSVDSLLRENLPRTLLLVGSSTIIALLVAIPMGTYQAVRRSKPDDYVLTGMSLVFYSMPSFFLGIILIIVLSDVLPLLPSTGVHFHQPALGPAPQPRAPCSHPRARHAREFSRYMRSSVIENLVQDYIRTARAKGVLNRGVLFLHAMPNALLPIITLVGLSLPGILSGASWSSRCSIIPAWG